MRHIGIIGTAGRGRQLSRDHYDWMAFKALEHIKKDDTLVSGGAAWADHVAVSLFLIGKANKLVLHLPAPLDLEKQEFAGGNNSPGGIANYYHRLFSFTMGKPGQSLKTLCSLVENPQVKMTVSPGFHARNALVARQSELMLAFTFGEGSQPLDGGPHTLGVSPSATRSIIHSWRSNDLTNRKARARRLRR
jgi:hypothetical protein